MKDEERGRKEERKEIERERRKKGDELTDLIIVSLRHNTKDHKAESAKVKRDSEKINK